MPEQTVVLNSDVAKKTVVHYIKKLSKTIQIEKKCSEKEANTDTAYFLQQIYYILTND